MTIKELREKRTKAWDEARNFLDSKRNESGLLSEEDSKTYDAMEQQIVAYGKEIQKINRIVFFVDQKGIGSQLFSVKISKCQIAPFFLQPPDQLRRFQFLRWKIHGHFLSVDLFDFLHL